MTDVLVLPDKLDTAAARDVLAALRSSRGHPLTLDASGTRGIGAICAQILASAHTAWATDGHALRLTGSAGLADDLALMGLSDLFDEMDTVA
jgi:anti-anti-sigma regulatory factor